jgi:hypothetical protein
MEYIIQENLFREEHYDLLHLSLERLGLKHTTVRVFPFIDKITDINLIPVDFNHVDDLPDFVPDDTSKVFMFGSTKMSRIVKERGWYIGTLLNDNHDYEVYSQYYKDNLLNYDSDIVTLTSKIKWDKDEVKFIRPTLDTKAFTGAVFTEIEFNDMIENYLHNYKSNAFNENTLIQIATPKNIYKEIRFWVVDGKIITGSQYRLGNNFLLDDNIEQDAIDYGQSMVDIFQLAEAFIIDVCLTENGWKIVECGCMNVAGFYKSDIQKMLMAVEDKFN